MRSDGGPEFNNVFFTRLGTKSSTRAQRFGANTIDVTIQNGPFPVVVQDGSPLDAVIAGSNAGVYDGFDPDDPRDWDGIPAGRKLDHAGGMQAIGNYMATVAEFVALPCMRSPFDPTCPEHGDRNIPAVGTVERGRCLQHCRAVSAAAAAHLAARSGIGLGRDRETERGAGRRPRFATGTSSWCPTAIA